MVVLTAMNIAAIKMFAVLGILLPVFPLVMLNHTLIRVVGVNLPKQIVIVKSRAKAAPG